MPAKGLPGSQEHSCIALTLSLQNATCSLPHIRCLSAYLKISGEHRLKECTSAAPLFRSSGTRESGMHQGKNPRELQSCALHRRPRRRCGQPLSSCTRKQVPKPQSIATNIPPPKAATDPAGSRLLPTSRATKVAGPPNSALRSMRSRGSWTTYRLPLWEHFELGPMSKIFTDKSGEFLRHE